MAAKPKRSRTLRREQDRQAARLAQQRHRLFLLEPGGSAQRPAQVSSSSIVESKAQGFTCPQCGGSQNVEEHQVRNIEGVRLREVTLQCPRCAKTHSVWFQILAHSLN